jgi:hypothetical protein
MLPVRKVAAPLFLTLVSACASGTGGGSGATTAAPPRRSSPVITAQEIAAASGSSAYDVVRQLRPAWFVTRGGNEPVAYVDGVRYGTLDDLRNVAVDTIREIRWIDSRDATTRYGTGHQGGVIEVITVRSPR